VFEPGEPVDALHGHVRFGLKAIKGIGSAAIESIMAERQKHGPFESLYDFCERLNSRTVNKAAIESLVKCGAFDSIHGSKSRAAMVAAIDDAIAAGQTAADDARRGQMNFFAAIAASEPAAAKAQRNLPSVTPWDQKRMLAGEKEVLGFHVSGHPLDQHEGILRDFCTATTSAVARLNHDAAVIIGGQLTRVRITFVKTGKSAGEKMAMITLQDKTGSIDGVVFSSVFAKYSMHLQEDAIVLAIGRVDKQRGEPQVIVDQVIKLADAAQFLAGEIHIDLADDPQGDPIETQMQLVAGLLQQAGAARIAEGGKPAEVFINITTDQQRYTLKSNRLRVIAEPNVLQRLRETVGPANVRIISGGIPRRDKPDNGYHGKRSSQRYPETVEV
jgi:DNA polymerase-3 subunit alpha